MAHGLEHAYDALCMQADCLTVLWAISACGWQATVEMPKEVHCRDLKPPPTHLQVPDVQKLADRTLHTPRHASDIGVMPCSATCMQDIQTDT